MSKTELQTLRERDSDMSAAWKIFNWQWDCQVRTCDNYTHNFFDTGGFFTTKNDEWDKNLRQAWMDRYLTINEMIEYTREGKTFIINKPHQSCIIYEILKTHALDWKEALEINPVIKMPPIEDFRIIDELLSVLWQIAKVYIDVQNGPSSLRSVFGKLMGTKLPTKTINTPNTHNKISNAIIKAANKGK